MPMRRIVHLLLSLSGLATLLTCKPSAGRQSTVKGKVATLASRNLPRQRVEDVAPLLQKPQFLSPRPTAWPSDLAWRPLRYSGPFTSGSELGEIQILLQGMGGVVYYNNFFTNHPSATIYKLYYRTNWGTGGSFASTVLPSNATPPLPSRLVPPPSPDGANSILMELRRIEYSSRYGGTVRLVFGIASYPTPNNQVHGEDFDYEFRKGDYLFDVSGLEMSIYEHPLVGSFNPTRALPFHQTISDPYVGTEQVEFTNGEVAAYKYLNSKVVPVPFDDAATAALQAVESQVAGGLPGDYVGVSHAQRFVLGFLHDQFQSLFQALSDPTDGAEKIWLSDNFADLTTKSRTAVFSLFFSLDHITLVDDDMEFWATNYHQYRSGTGDPYEVQSYPDNHGVGWAYVVRPIEGTSTPWIHLGTWNASECSNVLGDRISIRLADPGYFSTTSYGYVEFEVSFDCSRIAQLAQQGEWGNADEVSEHLLLYELDPSDPAIGYAYHAIIMATANARVVLSTR